MHENIIRIKIVANSLKGLGISYVFVGGATVSLYAGVKAVLTEIRPTEDVDVVIELATYGGYAKIDERLRELGFSNDVESGVLCRYKLQGIIVDMMPTETEVLGFSNKWYPEGYKHAIQYTLDESEVIQLFSIPYFLAAKWEAFKSRGGGDLRTSHDFEDIVYVLENGERLIEELRNAPKSVRTYLRKEFGDLLNDQRLQEGIYCHLTGGYYGEDANDIIQRLKEGLEL